MSLRKFKSRFNSKSGPDYWAEKNGGAVEVFSDGASGKKKFEVTHSANFYVNGYEVSQIDDAVDKAISLL